MIASLVLIALGESNQLVLNYLSSLGDVNQIDFTYLSFGCDHHHENHSDHHHDNHYSLETTPHQVGMAIMFTWTCVRRILFPRR